MDTLEDGEVPQNTEPQQQQLNKSSCSSGPVLKQTGQREPAEFVDFMFEKCWTNLMHYASKHRTKLQTLGTIREARQLKDLDCFLILLERRMHRFPTSFNKTASLRQLMYQPIHRRTPLFKVNRADLIYLDLGNLDAAIDQWIGQLDEQLDTIATFSSQKRVCDFSYSLAQLCN